MGALSGFFRNILNSFTSAGFYQTLLKTPFSFSLKYFLFLTFLLSFVTAIFATAVIGAGAKLLLQKGPGVLKEVYPNNLKIEINNGRVKTNVKEPLIIPSRLIFNANGQDTANFLVIDTKTPFSLTKFNSYNTDFWLTNDSLVLGNSQNNLQMIPLSNFNGFSLNKNEFVNAVTTLTGFLQKYLLYILIGLGSFIIVSSLTGHFAAVLILGVFAFLLLRLAHYKFNYAKSLQLVMHAATLPLILSAFPLGIIFALPVPFWQGILALIILFYLLSKNEH
ncbi:MAG: DUF1189 domain-containing protein [Patescibacteria group bacterium]|nr:DUF1189 domain-containing protein [Patescibacteria group bacterium]